MFREPKLPHVLCGLSFCEACHFVRPIPVFSNIFFRILTEVSILNCFQRRETCWKFKILTAAQRAGISTVGFKAYKILTLKQPSYPR